MAIPRAHGLLHIGFVQVESLARPALAKAPRRSPARVFRSGTANAFACDNQLHEGLHHLS